MTELLNISELKKDPTQLIGKSDVCVIKYGKPVFFTVSPERMAQLSEYEKIIMEQDFLDAQGQAAFYAKREMENK